jgi:ribosomal protein L40E
MTKCHNCGRMNPDRSAFCDRCGKPLIAEQILIQSRECPKCGALNTVAATSCKACSTVLPSLYPDISSTLASTGSPAQTDEWLQDSVDARSQKPSIAALLMVGAGILELFTAMRGFTAHVPTTDLPMDVSGFVFFCASLELLMGLIVIIGAYVAFKRGSFTLTVIATIAGMLAVGPFAIGLLMSLIALVLVALSRDEFEG